MMAQFDLGNIRTLYNQYSSTKGQAGSALTEQVDALKSQLNSLISNHALIKQAADTYDQDFLDRVTSGRTEGVHGFWARRGVSTLQDWVLLLFFMTFAGFLAVCILYTVRFSSKKVFTILFILVFGPILAAFFASLLLRFG